jgi:hypothetical protein
MSQTSPVPPSAEEPLAYQPLAALAVAGFAVSVLFAGIVTVGGVMALVRGQPFLLENWTLLLPLAGILLSYLGQVQIRQSEGTRAGQKLAQWGLMLSLVFGLGYFVYGLGTGLAIRQQAHAFLMEAGPDSGFFPHLSKSNESPKELYIAFLLTLAPADRVHSAVDDPGLMQKYYNRPESGGEPGPLFNFMQDRLVRLFRCGSPSEIKVEALGVREWRYDKGGYVVRRYIRISNEEGDSEAVVSVKSIEGGEGETRRWSVDMKNSGIEKSELNALGKTMERLRFMARIFVEKKAADVNKAKDSIRLADVDGTDWQEVVSDDAKRKEILSQAEAAFTGGKGAFLRFEFPGNASDVAWKRHQGKLKIELPFTFTLIQGSTHRYNFVGTLDVVSRDVMPTTLEDWQPTWEIANITFTQVHIAGPKDGPF